MFPDDYPGLLLVLMSVLIGMWRPAVPPYAKSPMDCYYRGICMTKWAGSVQAFTAATRWIITRTSGAKNTLIAPTVLTR